jgi:UDP-N-acetylmuramate: L-alanyl-gamma-D-glutamyl-meso-diaminopimelate ligase
MHIHILAIAGGMTAPLAAELKRLGHKVTGSDQDKIYPPWNLYLQNAGIKINQTKLDNHIDLVIVGSGFKNLSRPREEFDFIRKLNIPYISATQYIAQNIAKDNSILIAGTYGKTTTSALTSWILFQAGRNPSFMYGGQAIGNLPSLRITSSDWSVLEADESINGLDIQAKFLYYPLRYLLLTSADWEHKDSYSTQQDNFRAFKSLVDRLPSDGLLLINSLGTDTKKLSSFSAARVVTYNGKQGDYRIVNTTRHKNKSILHIHTPTNKIFKVETPLIAAFNHENILGAFALCCELGLDPPTIAKAILAFSGIKRRLEQIADKKNILFFDDFAQSPNRIQSAIGALKSFYPHCAIKVFFEPHASSLQNKKALLDFKTAFTDARQVIISRLSFSSAVDPSARTTAKDFLSAIGPKAKYLPINGDIINHFTQSLQPNDILIHMSSGGLDGLDTFKKIISNL